MTMTCAAVDGDWTIVMPSRTRSAPVATPSAPESTDRTS